MRSILSACLVRPRWEVGPFRVEGPDEDAFTLGLSAIEGFGPPVRSDGPNSLSRLHLIGPFAPSAEWAFGEALGLPALEVRRHPPTSPGLWGGLAAAAHDGGPVGREAVLAAEPAQLVPESAGGARIRSGAGAMAFLLGSEPGLALLRHGFRGHTPGRSFSMKESVADWLAAVDLPRAGGKGEVVFAAEEDSGRWQATWEESAPGVVVTMVEAPAAEVLSGAVRSGRLLWELGRRLRTGGVGLVGESRGGRRGFAGFRLDGPVRWVGDWGSANPGSPPPTPHFLERDPSVDAVSQGAYVPYPRYLENLPSRWRLLGERCPWCHSLTFPSSSRCRSCLRADGLLPEALPRRDLTVEAVTTIAPGAQPTEFDAQVAASGPYDVAMVALGEGRRATVQVTDVPPGGLGVGDRVRLVLRRLYPMEGEWRYGLKAVRLEPTEEAPPASTEVRSTAVRRAGSASSGVPRAHRATPRGRASRARTPPRRAR